MKSKNKEATRVNVQERSRSSKFTNNKFSPLNELVKDPLVESAHMLGHRLLVAAENGDAKEVLNLISQGADVNVRNPSNVTPLMCAAREGHTKVCRILVENGADVNARVFHSGDTVLMMAVKQGRVGTVRFLLSVGANPLIENAWHESVEHWSRFSPSAASVIILGIILKINIKLWAKKLNTFSDLISNKHFRTPEEFKAVVKFYTKLSSKIYPAVRNCSPDSVREIIVDL